MENQRYQSFNPIMGRVLDIDLVRIVWESHALTEKEEEVQRSLRERLFSLPWKPFDRTKIVVTKEPAMFSYTDPASGRTTFVCHPAFKERIRHELSLLEVH